MKGRLLAFSLLAVASLAAYGIVDKTAGADTYEQPKIEAVEVSKEDYLKKIGELHQKMNDGFQEMQLIAAEKDSKDRDKKVADQIQTIQDTVNGYKAMKAPAEFTEIHTMYLEAAKDYDKGLSYLRKGLAKKDNETLRKADPHFAEASALWTDAFAKLSEMTPVPLGDGTITTEDLKDLDKTAGIDRDAVRKNISEDGHELIGKWGFKNAKPSIVLYEDGRYEGYANDTYPSKDNAFIGKWEWDHSRKIIVFTNEKLFDNGKETKMNRPQMTLEVLNFGGGELYMRDIETWGEFKYEKKDEAS
ncbi:DUF3994 domain-containing protein [Neobacillus notoginsengisoli]|uniref:DUF3994 domain-containing protein n=1 Tax=Neobacillus notoginsengisoli TaxID=1578198 RepID=A0A417YWW3_9BACI|nr:DUF3994 domain-containing protein [Neobacillus notoginsengisoli]RHW41980.1 DUF3994 domain-containing protein [Neobacillus notoginsengisoli]